MAYIYGIMSSVSVAMTQECQDDELGVRRHHLVAAGDYVV
jgi:hypothetical protein